MILCWCSHYLSISPIQNSLKEQAGRFFFRGGGEVKPALADRPNLFFVLLFLIKHTFVFLHFSSPFISSLIDRRVKSDLWLGFVIFIEFKKSQFYMSFWMQEEKTSDEKKRCKNLVGQSQSASHAFSPSLIFLREKTVCSKLSTDLRRREPRTICLCVESKFHSSLSLFLVFQSIHQQSLLQSSSSFSFLLSSSSFPSSPPFFSFSAILASWVENETNPDRHRSRPNFWQFQSINFSKIHKITQ